MAAPITNPPAINGESKSARKKKAKAEVSSPSPAALETPPASEAVPKENGHAETHPEDTSTEHVHIKELQKQIRNINKKLTATHKADSVITENPGVSLDDLVAQRKLNNDQKASILKKPQLQAQLGQLEEQIKQFRDFEADFKQQLSTQKRELEARHQEELSQLQTKLQEAQSAPATTTGQSSTNSEDLGAKVLIFSQFLRTAASKRAIEEDATSPENMAFEGALLLVYGGDDKAVEAALNLIEGADVEVPGIDGELLPVKYSQIKNASIAHSAQPIDDSSAPSTSAAEAVSDPTISHAGLTELDDASALNGSAARETAPGLSNETSNLAGERWDTTSRQDSGLEEGYEIVPRPNEEVDTPVVAPQSQEKSTSWADDAPAAATGNTAGENWDTKVPQQGAASWADETAAANPDDGFQQIPNRPRGRGGRGRGDGENRGRGGRGRGGFRGEFRGGHDGDRGRGGPRGGFRGNRGDGERGGRGGRGRGGPRGDATAAPRA